MLVLALCLFVYVTAQVVKLLEQDFEQTDRLL